MKSSEHHCGACSCEKVDVDNIATHGSDKLTYEYAPLDSIPSYDYIVKSKSKKIVKYPNKFISFSKLPEYVKNIMQVYEKSKHIKYLIEQTDNCLIALAYNRKSGVLVAGIAFKHKDDKIYNDEKATKIAFGRLRAQLEHI